MISFFEEVLNLLKVNYNISGKKIFFYYVHFQKDTYMKNHSNITKCGFLLLSVSAPVGVFACSKKEEKKSPASLTMVVEGGSDAQNYEFGAVAQGQKKDVTIVISNTGEESATALSETGLEAPFTLKGGTFPGTGGTCTDTLAGGASCNVVVEYAPTVPVYTAVPHTDAVVFSYSGKTTSEFSVTGTGDYCSSQAAVAELSNATGASTLAYESPTLVMAQSFTPSSNLDLAKVTLNLYKGQTASLDTVVLRLRSNSSVSGNPEAVDLATATVQGSAVGTSIAAVTFTFSEPVALTSGTKYWFVVDPGTSNISNGTLSTYLYVKGAFSDTFSGGEVKFGTDDSTSWNAWTYDLNFEMKQCTAPATM